MRLSRSLLLSIAIVALVLTPFKERMTSASAQPAPIVVNHSSLSLFDQIPSEYLTAALQTRMMFLDASVGASEYQGLICLRSTFAAASLICRRNHVLPAWQAPISTWTGSYPTQLWVYYGYPTANPPPGVLSIPCPQGNGGTWHQALQCFVTYVDAFPNDYDVYSIQYAYTHVDTNGTIAGPQGFFAPSPVRYDVTEFDQLRARHPSKVFVLHTPSLARGIGTQVSTDFSQQMRNYAALTGLPLLDIADIESHSPIDGSPCYDNRDGVPYSAPGQTENWPTDGVQYPALCQHYTTEANGGHLLNPARGMIDMAKAWIILMAQIAGWQPGV